jgi:hypothetical protein
MKLALWLLLPTLLLPGLSAYANGETREEYTGHLASFVRGSWEHGIPYTEARAFGPEALPYLREWLKADPLREQWTTIVWMIGYIGQPEDFETLREFLEDRFTGEVDGATFNALISAIHVMGHVAVSSDKAMAYLRSATNPNYFQKIKWTHETSDVRDLHVLLSKLAINALGTTGRPEAEQILKDIQRKPYDKRQLGNVALGLEIYRGIATQGRVAYFQGAGLSVGESKEGR